MDEIGRVRFSTGNLVWNRCSSGACIPTHMAVFQEPHTSAELHFHIATAFSEPFSVGALGKSHFKPLASQCIFCPPKKPFPCKTVATSTWLPQTINPCWKTKSHSLDSLCPPKPKLYGMTCSETWLHGLRCFRVLKIPGAPQRGQSNTSAFQATKQEKTYDGMHDEQSIDVNLISLVDLLWSPQTSRETDFFFLSIVRFYLVNIYP